MFEEFVGNQNAKDLIGISVKSAIKGKDKLTNMLFTGKAGIGKTYISSLVAEEVDALMCNIDGTNLKSSSSTKIVVKAIANLIKDYNQSTMKRAIIFIDEAHSIHKKVDDMFLRIISENIIQIEKNSELIEYPIRNKKTGTNNFLSFIFATNRASELSPALRSRLKTCTVPFVDYTQEEKEIIAEGNLDRKGVYHEKGVCEEIAKRAWTARDVESGCEGIYNYSLAEDIKTVTLEDCNKYFKLIGVDENGLNPQEREYVQAIVSSGGEASLNILSCKMGVPVKEITEMIEPKIIALGIVDITSKGRSLTGNKDEVNMFEVNK